jgi:hypothetical protein
MQEWNNILRPELASTEAHNTKLHVIVKILFFSVGLFLAELDKKLKKIH